MREIRFRGKRIDIGRWVEGSYLKMFHGLHMDGNHYIHFIVDTKGIRYEVYPETIGQYTGLKDKNGKEIYEGDIIEFDKWLPNETFVRVIRGEVYWSDKGYWAVRNKDGKFLELLGRTENTEQIGNKYENPELLQEEWEERT